MLIYILFVIYFIMLILGYFLLKKDIIQPVIIFLIVYTFSILCAIFNIKAWNINLDIPTFLLLLFGGLEFVAISFIINKIFKNNQNNKIIVQEKKTSVKNSIDNESEYFNIGKYKVLLVSIYCALILVALIFNVLDIANKFGEYSNFSQALTLFKQHTSYKIDAKLPSILLFLQKPVFVFAYIFLFIFIKKILYTTETKRSFIFKNWYYLIPPIEYVAQELILSNRLASISIILAAVTMYLLLWNMKNNWEKNIKLNTIIKIGIGGVIGLILFYFSASLVGRINSKGPIEYITLYCGGSIECLNQFMSEPPKKSNILGKETFYYLIKNLDNYKIIEISPNYPIHLEFRYNGRNMIGNVYTAYRRWLYDFGVLGVIILQAIMAIFYNIFYNILKHKNINIKIKSLLIILYSYMIYALFLHPIDGYFYLLTVRLAFLTSIIIFILAYIFLFELDIKIKNGVDIKLFGRSLMKLN